MLCIVPTYRHTTFNRMCFSADHIFTVTAAGGQPV